MIDQHTAFTFAALALGANMGLGVVFDIVDRVRSYLARRRWCKEEAEWRAQQDVLDAAPVAPIEVAATTKEVIV